MASLMENLIDVLDRESTEYEALLQLSQRKTPIIAGGDLAELQKITDEEQELVSRIHNLDKQRAGVTADIADVLNRDVNDLKLPNLITMLSARPAEQQALADSHDRLQAAVRGLKRVNEQNSELLNSALEMVEFEMNLLQGSMASENMGATVRYLMRARFASGWAGMVSSRASSSMLLASRRSIAGPERTPWLAQA